MITLNSPVKDFIHRSSKEFNKLNEEFEKLKQTNMSKRGEIKKSLNKRISRFENDKIMREKVFNSIRNK